MSALSSKSKIRYFIWPTLLHRLSTAPSIHPESCPATRSKWMLHRLSTAPSICPESCPATRLKWMLHRFSTAPSIRPESCPETPMTWMMNRLSTASSTHPEPPPDPALEWMKVLFHKTITRYIDNWYNLPIKARFQALKRSIAGHRNVCQPATLNTWRKKINQLRVELCPERKQKRVLEERCKELDANISELDPTLLEAVKELQSAECGVDTYASMMCDQVTCCS